MSMHVWPFDAFVPLPASCAFWGLPSWRQAVLSLSRILLNVGCSCSVLNQNSGAALVWLG